MYICFDCQNDEYLFQAVRSRFAELGYDVSHYLKDARYNTAIEEGEERVLTCQDMSYARMNPSNYTIGTLDDLFYTDKYKFVKPFFVKGKHGEYEGSVYTDTITFSDIVLTKKDIKKLAEYFFTVTEKEV